MQNLTRHSAAQLSEAKYLFCSTQFVGRGHRTNYTCLTSARHTRSHPAAPEICFDQQRRRAGRSNLPTIWCASVRCSRASLARPCGYAGRPLRHVEKRGAANLRSGLSDRQSHSETREAPDKAQQYRRGKGMTRRSVGKRRSSRIRHGELVDILAASITTHLAKAIWLADVAELPNIRKRLQAALSELENTFPSRVLPLAACLIGSKSAGLSKARSSKPANSRARSLRVQRQSPRSL